MLAPQARSGLDLMVSGNVRSRRRPRLQVMKVAGIRGDVPGTTKRVAARKRSSSASTVGFSGGAVATVPAGLNRNPNNSEGRSLLATWGNNLLRLGRRFAVTGGLDDKTRALRVRKTDRKQGAERTKRGKKAAGACGSAFHLGRHPLTMELLRRGKPHPRW